MEIRAAQAADFAPQPDGDDRYYVLDTMGPKIETRAKFLEILSRLGGRLTPPIRPDRGSLIMIHWNDKAELASFLAAARGDEPVDLKLTNCRVVDLFNLTMDRADLAIHQGRIVGLGDYQAKQTMDLNQGIVGPSFIDGHIHIESTMLTPSALAKVIVPQGTGALAADPHEIANVLGLEGIRFMLEDSEGAPLEVFFTAPSCVPASPLESSGAKLEAADLIKAAEHPRVIGLAEMMNFPGVINGQDDVLDKLIAFRGRPLDGHAPMLSGPALNAYAGAGPASDHECSQLDEAVDKLKRGIRIMIRQGSTARKPGGVAAPDQSGDQPSADAGLRRSPPGRSPGAWSSAPLPAGKPSPPGSIR